MTATATAPTSTITRTTTKVFRAMGCQIEAQLVHDASPAAERAAGLALSVVAARFAMDEDELSRFIDTSGLARLNRAAGTGPVAVSPLLLAITRDALAAARATGGLFDPTLGTVLAHLGYDRPFPFPTLPDASMAPALLPAHQPGAWRGVAVDPVAGTISLPAGVALDLGGIGKGWTVDRMIARLRRVPGVRGGLVNAGGDLRVWGDAPDGDAAWLVGVEDPRDRDRDCAVLALNDRAAATSSTAYRRWQRGERWFHHLLDPRTGQPAATDLAAVTVVGPSAMWAEVHAKVALLLGLADGRAYLDTQGGYAALCIDNDGRQHGTAGIGMYLR